MLAGNVVNTDDRPVLDIANGEHVIWENSYFVNYSLYKSVIYDLRM